MGANSGELKGGERATMHSSICSHKADATLPRRYRNAAAAIIEAFRCGEIDAGCRQGNDTLKAVRACDDGHRRLIDGHGDLRQNVLLPVYDNTELKPPQQCQLGGKVRNQHGGPNVVRGGMAPHWRPHQTRGVVISTRPAEATQG
jgi:hypothetical protein